MYRLRATPNELLARPGIPERYSVSGAAALLGISRTRLIAMLPKRLYNFARSGPKKSWCLPRSTVVSMARTLFADRPVRLARILSDQGRILAITDDLKLRRELSPWEPLYAPSTFALGQMTCVVPCRAIVIDWESCGSSAAKAVAERLTGFPDRPLMIGVLPYEVNDQHRHWDALIARPWTRQLLTKAIDTGAPS